MNRETPGPLRADIVPTLRADIVPALRCKRNVQNRCINVSSWLHCKIAQLKDGIWNLFLESRFLVFSLSCSKSQKKNLCLAWQEDFHNHLKCGNTVWYPTNILYAFLGEKWELPQIYVHLSFSPSEILCLAEWQISVNCWNSAKACWDKGRWNISSKASWFSTSFTDTQFFLQTSEDVA